MHKKREKQDMHFLDENCMIACNPRDREAAHRAQMENIIAHNIENISCRKCISAVHKNKTHKVKNVLLD